ncbi:MAG: tRNA (adenosine(37)-N6)-threonylcarbamoyltransferase complex dimerization subunit type 1 TsaB [Candidatus Aureabacteria bacterium]|nr:tRNA (adenosine(37)-N6)-threonylcarbamoyltransferase complex dimerization subunit type 1 TsaB [Candidatus Auribacterota bacterium]
MSLLLGIETSTTQASIAIAGEGGILGEAALPGEVNPSAALMLAIDALLRAHGLTAGRLNGIAVSLGPGSFTGVRLGLATARGLALALEIPVRGVGTFDLLCADYAGEAAQVCPVVNAHSHGLYTAVYRKEGPGYRCETAPYTCKSEELPARVEGEVLFLGPHVSKFRDILQTVFGGRASFEAADRFPRASAAARLFDSPLALHDDPPGSVSPLYILPGVRLACDRGSEVK